MTDHQPQVQQHAQESLQAVVERLAAEHTGDDVERTRAALAEAIAAAGLPEQPEKWVTDTAAEVAAGRVVVVDRSVRDDDDLRRAH